MSDLGEAMSRAGRGTTAVTACGNVQPLRWRDVTDRVATGGWFWLASVRPNGAPHVMPVLAAWSDPVFLVASKASARKSRNLVADGRCVLTSDRGDLHLVVEGRAARLAGDDDLERASAAFRDTYGWPTTVVGDELDADYGAPTSGGPPYGVFAVTPEVAFAFPTDGEAFTPTRWRFG